MHRNMPRATLTLAIPESSTAFINRQVEHGGYASREEYVARLIEDAQVREQQDRLEAALMKGLESPAEEVTGETFAKDREEFERRLAGQHEE